MTDTAVTPLRDSMNEPELVCTENVPLAPMTTFGIGGPARYFVRAESTEQLVAALQFANENGLRVFILGGGSNLLVSDSGFDGLVIQIASRGISIGAENDVSVDATAAAGEDWDGFVAFCVEHDLAGVECLSGIPGLVGGTPIQNVGAYGQEVSQTMTAVSVLDRRDRSVRKLPKSACGFAYRSSIFNTTERDRYVILDVTFRLEKGGEPNISYRDLKEHFAGGNASLAATRDAVLEIRRSKSMVIDANDPNSRSAGSFFKNPIISRAEFERLTGRFENVPSFEVDEQRVKLPAAWLIEHAGFAKGYSLGNAGISGKHTLALINRSGAKAADIIALKNEIEAAVLSRFGIALEAEPIFIGVD